MPKKKKKQLALYAVDLKPHGAKPRQPRGQPPFFLPSTASCIVRSTEYAVCAGTLRSTSCTLQSTSSLVCICTLRSTPCVYVGTEYMDGAGSAEEVSLYTCGTYCVCCRAGMELRTCTYLHAAEQVRGRHGAGTEQAYGAAGICGGICILAACSADPRQDVHAP